MAGFAMAEARNVELLARREPRRVRCASDKGRVAGDANARVGAGVDSDRSNSTAQTT